MNKSLFNEQRSSAITYREYNSEGASEVDSLEDIPDFDHPETEIRYWRTHRLSKNLFDELPKEQEDEH